MTEAALNGLANAPTIVDRTVRRSAIERVRAQKIVLPTFAQLSWRIRCLNKVQPTSVECRNITAGVASRTM